MTEPISRMPCSMPTTRCCWILQTWIGAIAGAAMIFGAIRMRRYRDEG